MTCGSNPSQSNNPVKIDLDNDDDDDPHTLACLTDLKIRIVSSKMQVNNVVSCRTNAETTRET